MKNIYDILNDIEVDLDKYEKEDFTDIEKQNIKRNFRKSIHKKSKNYNKFIAVASMGIITLGILSNGSLRTYAYEKLSNIGENIKYALGINDNIDEYAKNINQSVTRNGLKISIKEVVLDENELLIYLEHEYNRELKPGESVDLISENLYVNGKKINKGNSGYYTKRNGNKTSFVIGYNLNPDLSKGNIDVKLSIIDAYKWYDEEHEGYKRIFGPWIFKFSVNGDNLAKDTKYVKLDKKINLDNDKKINLIKYKQNPINQILTFKKSNAMDSYGEKGILVFKGTDNLGNEICFIPKSGYVDKSKYYEYEFDSYYYKFNSNAKFLKLNPYLETNDYEKDKVHRNYEKVGEEFVINLKS